MKIVITGGHHNSALPVILELKKQKPGLDIHWFGHKHSIKGDTNNTLEYEEITQLKIPFYELHAGKLYKTYDPIRLLKVPFGIFHALYLLLKIKPDLIVSFGGYLAAPTVIAGKILGIKSITHEQTVVAGYANKVIAKYADRILISWPQSKIFFPLKKTVLTGLPLRPEITEIRSNSFVSNNSLPTVYITAGKTGSHTINLVVKDCLEQLLEKVNVIHQCGDTSVFNDFDTLKDTYESIKSRTKGDYFLRKFVFSDEIGEAFQRSSFVISRSGAHITSEILALEKPSILIPIPWVSHNEQFENAKILKNAGIGIILEESTLNAKTLMNSVDTILKNLERFSLKDKSYKDFIVPDATLKIVNNIIEFL